MIVGEILRGQLRSAILALVPIPCVNILPRKFDRALWFSYYSEKTNYGREFDRKTYRMDLLAVLLDHFHLAQTEQGNSLLPVYDPQRLIGDI